MEKKVKVLGTRKKLTPEESLRKMEALNREMELLRPYKKPKGILLKFKTYEELDDFVINRAAREM